jgi:hypothetical protein
MIFLRSGYSRKFDNQRGMKNPFGADISDGYSSFYFTTVGAIFVMATNSTLAWSGFESVSHVNIL